MIMLAIYASTNATKHRFWKMSIGKTSLRTVLETQALSELMRIAVDGCPAKYFECKVLFCTGLRSRKRYMKGHTQKIKIKWS